MKSRSLRTTRPWIAAWMVLTVGVAALALPANAEPLDAATEAAEQTKRSPALVKMDKILDQAGSLDEFLKRDDLQSLYFKELQAYMGPDKMKPEVFKKIIQQFRETAAKVPGYGADLWEKRRVRFPFTLEYQFGPKSPYSVNKGAWDKWIAKYQEGIKEKAQKYVFIKKNSPDSLREELRRQIQVVDERAKEQNIRMNSPEFRAEIARTHPGENLDVVIKRLRAEARQELLESKEVQEVIAYGLYERLTGEERIRDALRSGDGESILNVMSEIQNEYPKIFESAAFKDIKISAIFRDAAKAAVPNAQRLARDSSLFTRLAGGSRITYYESHRPIHSAFRAVFTGECVGGSCSYLDKTTAARHSVPVLKGTETRFAENAEHDMTGFTEIVPVVNSSNNKKYGSLLIGDPSFKNYVFIEDPDHAGEMIKTTVFDLWLETTPKFENGIVMSGVGSGDNAGVLHQIKSNLTYQAGGSAGNAALFEHLPENQAMANEISRVSSDSFRYNGRQNMIFDAMLPGAKELVIPEPLAANELEGKLRGFNREQKLSFLERTMGLESGQKERYFKNMRFLLQDKDADVKGRAALWVASGGIQSDEALPAIEKWVKTGAPSSNDVVGIVELLKKSKSPSPAVLKALADRFPAVANKEAREWLIKTAGLSAADVTRIASKADFTRTLEPLNPQETIDLINWYAERAVNGPGELASRRYLEAFASDNVAKRGGSLEFFTQYIHGEGLDLDEIQKILRASPEDSNLLQAIQYLAAREVPANMVDDLLKIIKVRERRHTEVFYEAYRALIHSGWFTEDTSRWIISAPFNDDKAWATFKVMDEVFQKNLLTSLRNPALSWEEKNWALGLAAKLKPKKLNPELERFLIDQVHKRTLGTYYKALQLLGMTGVSNDILTPHYIYEFMMNGHPTDMQDAFKHGASMITSIADDAWLEPIIEAGRLPRGYSEDTVIALKLLSMAKVKTSDIKKTYLSILRDQQKHMLNYDKLDQNELISRLLEWAFDPQDIEIGKSALGSLAWFVKGKNVTDETLRKTLETLITKVDGGKSPVAEEALEAASKIVIRDPRAYPDLEPRIASLLKSSNTKVKYQTLEILTYMEPSPSTLPDLLAIGRESDALNRYKVYQVLKEHPELALSATDFLLAAARTETETGLATSGVLQALEVAIYHRTNRNIDFDPRPVRQAFEDLRSKLKHEEEIQRAEYGITRMQELTPAYLTRHPEAAPRRPAPPSAARGVAEASGTSTAIVPAGETSVGCVQSRLSPFRQWLDACIAFAKRVGRACNLRSLPK